MARELKVSIIGDASSLQRAFGNASDSSSRFGRSVGNLGKAAGAAGAAISAGLGYGLVSAAKSAVSFEREMRNVNSIAQLSEKQFGNISKAVTGMAGDVAQKPQVLAKGLYDLVSSGFKAADAVKVLRVSARAASAGMTDTATSAKAVVAALNAYHLSATDARKVSDVLFQTVNKGVLTFEELSQNMGDLVPAAAPLGVTLEEVGASMATITKGGVPAAEAATRVKNTMLQLAKPSKALSGLLRDQGFASGEAAIKALGFSGVLQMLDKATQGSVTETAKLTPEIRALLGVVGLTGKNLEDYNAILASMQEASKGTGATSRALAEQAKSVAFQWQKATAAWEAAKITLGTALLPTLSAAATAVGNFISKFDKAEGAGAKLHVVADTVRDVADRVWQALRAGFNAIDWGQVWSTVRSQLTAGAERLGNFLSGIKIGANLSAALDKVNWNTLAARIGAGLKRVGGPIAAGIKDAFSGIDWSVVGKSIIAGISAQLSGSIELAKKLSETVMGAFRQIQWVEVGKIAGPGLAAAMVVAFTTLLDPAFWIENWDLALAVALVAFRVRIAAFAGRLLAAAGKYLRKAGDDMVQAVALAIESFSPRLAAALLNAVTFGARMLASGFKGLWGIVENAAKAVWNLLPGLLQKIAVVGFIGAIGAAISAAAGAVVSAGSQVVAAVKALGSAVVTAIIEILTGLPGKVAAAFGGLAGAITSAASGVAVGALALGQSIVSGITGGLGGLVGQVAGELGKLPGTIATLAGEVAGAAVTLGQELVTGLLGGVQGRWGQFTAWLAAIPAKVQSYFSSAGSWLQSAGLGIFEGLWDGIRSKWQAVSAWIGQTPARVKAFFASAIDWLESAGLAIIGGLWDGIRAKWSAVASWLAAVPGKVKGYFAAAGSWLLAAGTAIITGLAGGIRERFATLAAWFGSVPGQVKGYFTGAGSWLTGAGAAIVQGMIDGIESMLEPLRAAARKVRSAVSWLGDKFGSTPAQWGAYAVGAPLVQGIIDGMASKVSGLKGKAQEVAQAASDAMVEALRNKQQAFRDAWSGYSQSALAVFDEIAGKAKTASEKILENMRLKRETVEIKVAVTETRTALATAKAAVTAPAPEGETPEQAVARVAAANEAVLAAQKAHDDALYRQEEAKHTRLAALQRAKLDERTALSRLKFEAWLGSRDAQTRQEIAKEGLGQQGILDKIKEYNPQYRTRGQEVGQALAFGLNDMRGDVRAAAMSLADLMKKALGIVDERIAETKKKTAAAATEATRTTQSVSTAPRPAAPTPAPAPTATTAAPTAVAGQQAAAQAAANASTLAAQKALDAALYAQMALGFTNRAALATARYDQWFALRTVQQQAEVAKEGAAQRSILDKIKSYLPLYRARGQEIGEHLALGLLDMRGHVRDAALELADEIARAIGIGANAAHAARVNAENRLGGAIPRTSSFGGTASQVAFARLEASPETTTPLANARGAGGGDVNIYVAGSVVTERELAETVRVELMRVGRFNAGGVLGSAT